MRLNVVVVASAVLASVAIADPRPVRPPRTGTLTVLSQQIATIFVDDKAVGDTPVSKLAVTAGRHVMRAVRSNGDAQRYTIEIAVGKDTPFSLRWDSPPGPPAANPDSGFLALYSKPIADIWLDGVDTGMTTPVSGKSLPAAPGRHKVTFVIGSDRYTYAVVVKSRETITMTKDLE